MSGGFEARVSALAHARRALKDVQRVRDVFEERRGKPSGLYVTSVEVGWLDEAINHLQEATKFLREETL